MELTVCFFGSYDRGFVRNRILLKSLRRAGLRVVELRDPTGNMFLRYLRLLRRLKAVEGFDVLFCGFPSHWDVPLARLASLVKGVPVVFDAFLSLYDSMVYDRGLVAEGSLTALKLYSWDKVACALSDVVLLDTYQHIRYFVETFREPLEKFRRVWIGADDDVFYPRKAKREEGVFKVFFHGSFIPLQGVHHIVKAAKLLKEERDVLFELVGKGQTFNEALKLAQSLGLNNLRFLGWVDYHELPNYLARADVCLGIFGDTAKARRVIPNKVYEALAMAKPVVTGDTPAAREALTHGVNAWLCKMSDPRAIAEAVLVLKDDEGLRKRLALNGYRLFKERFSTEALGRLLKGLVREVLEGRASSRL